jgi:hypothetical protein
MGSHRRSYSLTPGYMGQAFVLMHSCIRTLIFKTPLFITLKNSACNFIT